MSAYIIADVDVHDEAQYAAYRELSSQAIREAGAEVLVRGGNPTTLEGGWSSRRVVVIKFPTREAAERFYHGDTYSRARKLREPVADMRMLLVDGV